MKKRLALFAVVVLLCTLCTVPAYAAVNYEFFIKAAKQNEEMAAGDVGKIDEMLDYEMAVHMYETAATLAPDKESEVECYLNAARVYRLLVDVSHDGTGQAANRYDSAAKKYELVAEITGEYEYYYGLAAQMHLEAAKLPGRSGNLAAYDMNDDKRLKEYDMAAVDYELVAERTGKNEYYIKAAEMHLEATKLVTLHSKIVNEYELAAKDYELAGEQELADKIRRNSMAFMLSDGYPEIVFGVGGLAVGFFAAMLIFRKKKTALSSAAAEDDE